MVTENLRFAAICICNKKVNMHVYILCVTLKYRHSLHFLNSYHSFKGKKNLCHAVALRWFPYYHDVCGKVPQG